jgi:hypothetical protein
MKACRRWFTVSVVGEGIEGAVDRYVAMARATRQLVILTSSPENASPVPLLWA